MRADRVLLRLCRHPPPRAHASFRLYATRRTPKHPKAAAPDLNIPRIRNVGIIAHIDAGKTTTTERMLFHSGYISHAGGELLPSGGQSVAGADSWADVDDGSTVTDYLPEERERGITITAAAIPIPWAKHTINLIDTPGHADFTFEVSRSLRVLDGAVAILDGVAGVEAQTETVWRQADEWNISRIAYVNKMDREGAGFGRTVREMSSRLGVTPIVLQLPVFKGGTNEGPFLGVVDLVESSVLTWNSLPDGNSQVSHTPLADYPSPAIVDEAKAARSALFETLADLDDAFLEAFVQHTPESPVISPPLVRKTLRSLTLRGVIVPILCGASFRDIGVQPLLDAIINYLPAPSDRPSPPVKLLDEDRETNLSLACTGPCALAFKIVHDPVRGPMVFIRVYKGCLSKGMSLENTRSKMKERANKLLLMYANDSVEVDKLEEGSIGVILGLKATVTGDTLVSNRADFDLQLQPIATPPPVFIASLEPHSLSEAQALSLSLQQLLREDPSLSVTIDDDSGQILLGGMGELHLEIARDKLINDFGAKCEMGKVRVSYRETLASDVNALVEKDYEREMNGKITKVGLVVNVSAQGATKFTPISQRRRRQFHEFGNIIDVDLSHSHAVVGMDVNQVYDAICSGVRPVLQSGPSLQLPLHSTSVQISNLLTFENQTTYQSIVSASRMATQEAFKIAFADKPSILMEPFMKVLITVDDSDIGRVVSDITSTRGGTIVSMDSSVSEKVVAPDALHIYFPPDITYQEDSSQLRSSWSTLTARVPLKEMVGYSKTLRSLTQGRGTFVMVLEGFETMSGDRAASTHKELTGLEL
jgi:elongation factor G